MERETLLQVAVSSVVVLVFVGVLAALGTTFSTNGSMTQDGGYALVAALAGFIVTMSVAGLVVTRYTADEDDEDDESDD